MKSIWDIAQYLEDNPDDHPQRWQLAKKLYKSCEYRIALEHLQILVNEDEPKINIVRYLAATYFRLNRHEEAKATLKMGIEKWPKEIVLLEQLARVIEASGDRLGSADIWDEIADLAPDHPRAERVAQKLRNDEEEELEEDHYDGGVGFDFGPGQICPTCGAHNTDEFDRCWQCHGHLDGSDSVSPIKPGISQSELQKGARIWFLAGGLAVVVLLSLSLFLTLQQYVQSDDVTNSVNDVLSRDLLFTRIVIGIVLLVVWPVTLAIALKLGKCQKPSALRKNIIGVLLATLTYLATWLPLTTMLFAPIILFIASLVLIAVAFRAGTVSTLKTWTINTFCVITASLIAFVAMQGTAPLANFTHIIGYIRAQGPLAKTGPYELTDAVTPSKRNILWTSTGSQWLDEKALTAHVIVKCISEAQPIIVELADKSSGRARTLVYKKSRSGKLEFDFDRLKTDNPYLLSVTGTEGTGISVTINSPLIPTIEEPEEPYDEDMEPSLNPMETSTKPGSKTPGRRTPMTPMTPRVPAGQPMPRPPSMP